MTNISIAAVSALKAYITGANGLEERIGKLTVAGTRELPSISAADVIERHVAADIAEKTSGVRYPTVHIYCEKVANVLREKLRRFSGTADLVVEIRVSHEHMDQLQDTLQAYAELVAEILDTNRGVWAPGVFYTGGYAIQFGAIKRGGRAFIQSAKVELTVLGSME